MVEVLNKIDLLNEEDAGYLQALHKDDDTVFGISAVTGEGLERLLDDVTGHLTIQTHTMTIDLDWAMGAAQSWLQREDVVEDETQSETGWTLNVRWTETQRARFDKQFPGTIPAQPKEPNADNEPSGEYHPLD